MDNMITLNNRSNEYFFHRGKPISFLTLRSYNTKLVINNTSLIIETEKYYFGFIKGKKTTKIIPIGSINTLEAKKLLSFTDLLLTAAFLGIGFFVHPLFFLVVPLTAFSCRNTNIVLSAKDSQIIKIPSSSMEEAKEFVRYFSDIYIEA